MDQPREPSCVYRVNLLPNVCQVRLDFLDLQTKVMRYGDCETNNMLTISTGPHQVAEIPVSQLCGTVARSGDHHPLDLDLPHLYIHFDTSARQVVQIPNGENLPYLQLDIKVDNHPATWDIRVSQITCDGASLQAPPGCAQWYTSISGTISSLNLADSRYQAGQSLTACIARDPMACAVKYDMKRMRVGPTKGGGLGYGLVCGDYIKFKGEKTGVCGTGDGRQMVLPTRGPLGFTFRSDREHIPGSDIGYQIGYSFQHDCRNLQYYHYPGDK